MCLVMIIILEANIHEMLISKPPSLLVSTNTRCYNLDFMEQKSKVREVRLVPSAKREALLGSEAKAWVMNTHTGNEHTHTGDDHCTQGMDTHAGDAYTHRGWTHTEDGHCTQAMNTTHGISSHTGDGHTHRG